MTDYSTDGQALVALPGGGQVSVAFLAQQGVPGYTSNPDGSFSVPGDANFRTLDGGTVPVAEYGYAHTAAQATAGEQTHNPAKQDPAKPDPTTPNDGARNASSAALLLKQYGLEQLVPIVDQWIRGGMSWEEAQLALYDRGSEAGKIFDARFPAIAQRQTAGFSPVSPAEYIAYEGQLQNLFRAYKLPESFASRASISNLLAHDVSAAEADTRVKNGFAEIATNMPQQVRQAFSTYYGPSTDTALASYMLDPKLGLAELNKEVGTAQVGGAGAMHGFQVGEDLAGQIARGGYGFAASQAGFEKVGEEKGLLNPTVSEHGDLTQQGIQSQFNLSSDAALELQRRLQTREANFRGGGGSQEAGTGMVGLR